MITGKNEAALMKNRADMYKFLSRIFILEVDAQLLSQMKAMKFPEADKDSDFDEAYKMLSSFLQANDESCITDLEVDYARIFLAAGVAQGLAAFPYESVYTNRKHLMNQEASEDALILYAAKGLEARKDMYAIPNDHIGLEFEYMARLCMEAYAAAEGEDEAAYKSSIQEQKNFCKEHIKRWVPMFANDVIKYAETDFYRGIGRLTRGFVREETAFLS